MCVCVCVFLWFPLFWCERLLDEVVLWDPHKLTCKKFGRLLRLRT